MRQGLALPLQRIPVIAYWLAGLWLFWQLPTLPSGTHLLWLLPSTVLGLWHPASRKPTVLLLAILWAWQNAHHRLQQRLEEGPPQSASMVVEISGLPQKSAQGVRFDARILGGDRNGQHIRLRWYTPAPPLFAGEQWRLAVRLRPIVGTSNPGGFDFEGWAFRQGIVATGSVQHGQLLGRLPSLDAWRDQLSQTLAALQAPLEGTALLRALLLGDRRGLSDRQWESLAATGTGHLMAISGLHLGLLALWVYWPVRWFMAHFRLPCRLLPAREWGLLATVPATLAYALLAGFSLPTQRAWLMLLLYVGSRLLLRHFSLWQVLGAAALLLTLLDPTEVLSAGFWLSFVAVAVLALASGEPDPDHHQDHEKSKGKKRIWHALRAQGAISLAMIPLGMLFFTRASLLSLPVNLVFIPLVGWVLLPLGLAGLLLWWLWPAAGLELLRLDADWLAQLQNLLYALAALPAMQWRWHGALWPWLFSLVTVLWWLGRKTTGQARLGSSLLALCLLMMPLWYKLGANLLPSPVLRLWVLDVGQGLSAVLQHGQKVLVYDSGPSFRNGGSMSERVLLPFLRHLGVDSVEVLVTSHADDDHAGGSRALLRAIPVKTFYSSALQRFPEAIPCQRGAGWQWGAVQFLFLYPRAGQPYLGNDSSCVLLVQWRQHRLLLPGDAGKTVEWVLQQKNPDLFPLDVLLPGHHGSNTASSAGFVARAHPLHAVFAAGRQNRFGFPKPEVVERLEAQQSQLHHTGLQGAVLLALYPDGQWRVHHWRTEHQRLWNWPGSPSVNRGRQEAPPPAAHFSF